MVKDRQSAPPNQADYEYLHDVNAIPTTTFFRRWGRGGGCGLSVGNRTQWAIGHSGKGQRAKAGVDQCSTACAKAVSKVCR